MKQQFTSAAEAAGDLSDSQEVKDSVEREVHRNRLVKTLLMRRHEKGLSQKQVADHMNCDPSKISKLESGNDYGLRIGDVAGYLSAVSLNMGIVLEDNDMPRAELIKCYVHRVHVLLEELAKLASEADDDTLITDKIHQFYGEVLFTFLTKFESNYDSLCSLIKVPEGELEINVSHQQFSF